jgi:hypothetical protein
MRTFLLVALTALGCSEAPSPAVDAASDLLDAAPDVAADALSDVAPDVAPDVVAPDVDTRPRAPVRFAFRPSWAGVTTVAVHGGFGRADDWAMPFVTLVLDGDTWRGTAMLLPGTYSYQFRVTGDAQAGGRAATFTRDIHDVTNLRSGLCAAGSAPSMRDPRAPCSILFVPQSDTPPRLFTVSGQATVGPAAAEGWLAVIERAEPAQSPAFDDRVTLGADGRFTFRVAVGQYRVVLLHPSTLSTDDIHRESLGGRVARRAYTAPFFLSADVAVPALDVAFLTYDAHQPRGDVTLPARFMFAAPAGLMARAAVYGPAPTNIEPWWLSDPSMTTATWDGAFTATGAAQMRAMTGARYTWGTLVELARPMGAPTQWTLQGAAFDVTPR